MSRGSRLRGQAPAVLRVLVLVALGATVVRAVGLAVGAWAQGSLGAVTTLFIGVVAPAWLFAFFPSSLGWRVLLPLGARRLAVAACWLSPLVRQRDLRGIDLFMGVWSGRPLPPPDRMPADAWAALAVALAADQDGDRARAHRIADALAHLPPGCRFPWLARVHAIEALVAQARARRDPAAMGRYAALGRGWRVRLLAARAPADGAVVAVVAPVAAGGALVASGGARQRHVSLLGAVARAGMVPAHDVRALAGAWRAELDQQALARLHARALELGVRGAEAHVRALRDQVMGELTALAVRADGAPVFQTADEPLGGRVRERLIEDARAALAALAAGGAAAAALPPLEAWERWLVLRAALERIDQHGGGGPALASLWRGGLRDAVWSRAWTLFDEQGAEAAWVALMMFGWVADRAELLGDLPAMLANRENARLALAVSA